MAAVMERQAAKETQIILIRSARLAVVFQGIDASVFGDVSRQVFTTPDGMIADFPNKPSDVGDDIHDPFAVRPLLANPLQEIYLCYLLVTEAL